MPEIRPAAYYLTPHVTHRCPNCGRHLPVYDPQSIYFACPACGLISDVTPAQQALPVVRSHDPSQIPAAEVPLALEQELVLGGRLYAVVGRHFQFVRYHIPTSDPDRAYSVYDSELTEWPLVDRHGRVAYYQHGPHGAYLLRPLQPQHLSLPQDWHMLDFHSGQRRRMSQRGLLETGFLEGEVRYAFAHQGDAFEFGCYEAPEDGTQYWLKFRRGGDNQPIEYSQALAAWTLEAEALQAGLRAAARGEVPAPEAEAPPRRRGNAGFLKRLFGVGKK